MNRGRFTTPVLLIVCMIALLTILAFPLTAQPADEAQAAKGIGPVYDAAHEITLDGWIQTVVTKHTPGRPAGMHLLVMGPEGLVDAHVGPFLSKETKAALKDGVPVRIVGAMVSLRGNDYLFARQMTVGGRTITVRSTHGVLSPMPASGHTHAAVEKQSQPESHGGAR
jgi:hypothetical protein